MAFASDDKRKSSSGNKHKVPSDDKMKGGSGGGRKALFSASLAIDKAIWPVAAILLFLIYYGSISNVLRHLSDVASIKFKDFTMSFGQKQLPEPPPIVGKILPQLDRQMLDYIIANEGKNLRIDMCVYKNEASAGGWIFKLEQLEMIKLSRTDLKCENKRVGISLKYTNNYDETRAFIFNVATSAVFKKS